MRRFVAVIAGIAFVTGTVGFALAQDPAAGRSKKAKTAVGTVKTVSADSVVVAGRQKGKEMEWTFALDAGTRVKKAGKDATARDLAPGDDVTVRYMDHEGKATALSVWSRRPGPALPRPR